MALNLSLSRLSLGGGGAGIPSLTMTGLTTDSLGDAAVVGDHASISVGFPSGVTAWSSQAWGTSYGDSTYGTGANPTTYVSGDPGNLYWEGLGDDGNTYRSVAPIRKAVATTSGTPDLSFAEDAPITPVSLSSYYTTNGNTLTYAFVDTPPTGLSVSAGGSLTGTPTTVTADANYTLGATDTYGRRVDLEVGIEITDAPDIAFASFTDSTDIGSLTTTVPNDGNWEWATVTDGGTAPTADGAGGWTGTILESGQVAVGASGADVEFNTTSSTGDGARDLYVYQRTSGGVDSNVVKQDFTADNTAPTLSSATPADNATDVAIDVTPALTFSENIFGVTGKDFYLYDNIDTTPVLVETFTFTSTTAATGDNGGSASISGAVITITPGASLDNGVQHSIRWEAGAVQDAHRNDVAANTGDTAYNFTTVSSVTNYIQASEDITNATHWSLNGSATAGANAKTDPLGGSTADVYQGNANGDTLSQTVTLPTASVTYNVSLYLQDNPTGADWQWARIFCDGNSLWWDMDNETQGSTGGSPSNIVATAEANGFYRVSFDFTASGTSISFQLMSAVADSSGTEGNGDIVVWGFQITQGSGVKTYVAT